MTTHENIVNEHNIDDFRSRFLTPEATLRGVERSVRVLSRLDVGVGKTEAADGLIASPRVYDSFDLVLYAAPSWDILNERRVLTGAARPLVPMRVLRGRPREQCGPYDGKWRSMERSRCSIKAKKDLCGPCQEEQAPCFYPNQFHDLKGVRLILCPEQEFLANRGFIPLLKERTGARRMLVILDEAKFLDSSFEVVLTQSDLDRFRQVLEEFHRRGGDGAVEPYLDAIRLLERASRQDLEHSEFDLPCLEYGTIYDIQDLGCRLLGDDFRYLGYDLAFLRWSRPNERTIDTNRAVHFIVRPCLNVHMLILSAHLRADYVAHRLGVSHIASPFENCVFKHSGTRIFNLRNRSGADRWFGKNKAQILDTFAVLIARNLMAGRTTLLVSKMKLKAACADYLVQRLARWGHHVRFVCEDYRSLPENPDPGIIPIIHYGIVGVNQFTAYETAYCLNSYYVPDSALNQALQDAEPDAFRVRVEIRSGPDMLRRVKIGSSSFSDQQRERLANMYLQRLEIDPVIQAVGRVRFKTKPREVVTFQMAELSDQLGTYTDVGTLYSLREALGVPSARDLDDALSAERIRSLIDGGLTTEQAAAALGISRSTAFRRLKAQESVRFPIRDYIRKNDTLVEETP